MWVAVVVAVVSSSCWLFHSLVLLASVSRCCMVLCSGAYGMVCLHKQAVWLLFAEHVCRACLQAIECCGDHLPFQEHVLILYWLSKF